MRIRPFRAADAPGVRACIAGLQDYERAIQPDRRPGRSVAARYLRQLRATCRDAGGRIFVADVGGRIGGFVCVWLGKEILIRPSRYAYVSDLFVNEDLRGSGLGRALLRRAERHAKARQVRRVYLMVLEGNRGARRAYDRCGFEAYERVLLKKLRQQTCSGRSKC